jgi:hypothetical protein
MYLFRYIQNQPVSSHFCEGWMRAETISRRLKTISREMRKRFFYAVPVAGAQIGLSRSGSYRAAEMGLIPTERDGRFELVPRQPWDRRVKKLLGSGKARRELLDATKPSNAKTGSKVKARRAPTANVANQMGP